MTQIEVFVSDDAREYAPLSLADAAIAEVVVGVHQRDPVHQFFDRQLIKRL